MSMDWWQVSIGSGNGPVPDGAKPLPELDQVLWHHMGSLDCSNANELTQWNLEFMADILTQWPQGGMDAIHANLNGSFSNTSPSQCLISCIHYTPRFNEVERGVYWFHLVHLSVCGQNHICSVSSTILIGSVSYLHILSSNFRRCVSCNVCFKIQKFEILAWDPIWLNGMYR